MTIANSNKFKSNILRDAIIVTITDTMTSILAGLVVISLMGFLAHNEDVEIDYLISNTTLTDGWHLTIITFSYISSKLTIIPQLFSVMASLMFLTFGIDSLYAGTEMVIVAVSNSFKVFRMSKIIYSKSSNSVHFCPKKSSRYSKPHYLNIY